MIIFALEPVFATIFGYFVLREVLSAREYVGAGLMLVGVVIYQLLESRRARTTA